MQVHRYHVLAKRRAITREEPGDPKLPEGSAAELADRLLASGSSPIHRLIIAELRERVQNALERLHPPTARSWCSATSNSSRRRRLPPCSGSTKGRSAPAMCAPWTVCGKSSTRTARRKANERSNERPVLQAHPTPRWGRSSTSWPTGSRPASPSTSRPASATTPSTRARSAASSRRSR